MPVTAIEGRGISLHHLTVGDGPDIVMVHGFLGNLAVWHLRIAPQLRRHFRVTTYDLRGHGYSEVTPDSYSAGDMAEDLRGLLDALGLNKVHLVGHSFGADICLYFAHLYPERVDRIAALEPGLAALVHQRKDAGWVGWSYWVTKLEEVGLTVPPEKRNDLEYLLDLSISTPKFYGPARGLPRNRAPLIRLIRETTLIADYDRVGSLTIDALKAIAKPVLLVYGERSHFLSSLDVLQEILPNQQTILLPGGEHFGPLEQPDLLARHLGDFFGSGSAPVPDATLQASAGGA